MKVARIDNGSIIEVDELTKMFPNTSFGPTGANEEFLLENSLMVVDENVAFDDQTQKLVAVAPFIDVTVVRVSQVEALSPAEIDAKTAARRAIKTKAFQAEAGKRLDDFAILRGYGSIVSVCTYADSTVPRYAADAARAKLLRDQWWQILNQIVAEVNAGTRPEPATFDEIASELPALTWE